MGLDKEALEFQHEILDNIGELQSVKTELKKNRI